MTGKSISRAQLLLQYYAALNELENETEPAMKAAEMTAGFLEAGFGHAEAEWAVA